MPYRRSSKLKERESATTTGWSARQEARQKSAHLRKKHGRDAYRPEPLLLRHKNWVRPFCGRGSSSFYRRASEEWIGELETQILRPRREVDMIKKVKGGYKVISEKSGRNMGGPYKTKKEAKKRLQQVEFFKRKKR